MLACQGHWQQCVQPALHQLLLFIWGAKVDEELLTSVGSQHTPVLANLGGSDLRVFLVGPDLGDPGLWPVVGAELTPTSD